MHIKKTDAIYHKNSDSCHVWEYPFPSQKMSFATATINGRYPEQQRVVNTDCEEIYFVLSGSGIVHSEKGDIILSEGDVYFFEVGELYWVEGTDLKLGLVNAPSWNPEQHHIVE